MTDAAPAVARRLRIRVHVGAPVGIGAVQGSERRVVPILGGSAHGPGFDGVILAGGNDTQLVRPDGVLEIDARYIVDCGGAGKVMVHHRALRRTAGAYFKGTIAFQATAGSLAWLNDSIFVASGSRQDDHVELDVVELV